MKTAWAGSQGAGEEQGRRRCRMEPPSSPKNPSHPELERPQKGLLLCRHANLCRESLPSPRRVPGCVCHPGCHHRCPPSCHSTAPSLGIRSSARAQPSGRARIPAPASFPLVSLLGRSVPPSSLLNLLLTQQPSPLAAAAAAVALPLPLRASPALCQEEVSPALLRCLHFSSSPGRVSRDGPRRPCARCWWQ